MDSHSSAMDWTNWCRLCGNVTATVKTDDCFQESILQALQLESCIDMICIDCYQFISAFISFKSKSSSLQEMFIELHNLSSEEDVSSSVEEIRARFGLSSVEGHETEGSEIHVEALEVESQEENLVSFEDHDDLDASCEEVPCKRKRKIEQTEVEKLYDFKCHVCDLSFLKMQLLATHCRDVHQCAPQVSCWCGQVLSSWKRLMAHKTKHTKDENELSCQECGVSYKTRASYDKHILTKHGPDGLAVKFICAICGKEFKERQIMKNHEKIHLPDELKLKHPCSYCGKKFVNNHCLKIHVARVHEKIALHTCELCGKGCITKSDLKWHMDKHVEERNFECEICHLMFKSTNSLRIHKRRHFNQDKAIVCSVCGKEFFSSAALSNHKLVHSDVKRYKCFCGHEYKRLESYKCHLNSTHTGERPFSCPWCNKTFVNSANCRKHKLKDHPMEVAAHEAANGKKGVSLALKVNRKS